jgi:large subunit ribosomal protein L21
MKYAVIQLAGKQYKVTEGETITVNRLDQEEGKEFTTSDVLLLSDGSKMQLGTPLLSGVKVKLKAVTHQKSDKIRVSKYKAKSRYHKVHGHRQHETTVQVVSIG